MPTSRTKALHITQAPKVSLYVRTLSAVVRTWVSVRWQTAVRATYSAFVAAGALAGEAWTFRTSRRTCSSSFWTCSVAALFVSAAPTRWISSLSGDSEALAAKGSPAYERLARDNTAGVGVSHPVAVGTAAETAGARRARTS